MKILITLMSDPRVRTVFIGGAAALLGACGGGGGGSPAVTAAPPPAAQAPVVEEDQFAATVTTADSADDQAGADHHDSAESNLTAAGPDPLLASLAGAPALASDPSAHSTSAAYHLYVSPNGADSGDGSEQSPFRTIGRAAKAARPSTVIHVAEGTYRENVRTNTHGKENARIRYVSDTKWGARLIGSGTDAAWRNMGNFTDIIGFDISGSGRLGIDNWGSYTLVGNNHIHNLSISGGCNGSGGAGVVNANYKGSDGDIIGNVIHDIGVPGKCNGVQGIYSSNRRGKIMNNVVYRASSYGIHLWHAATEVLIANNTVFANGSSKMGGGILVGAGDRPGGVVVNHTRVINNIVYKNPAAGIKQYCYSGQNCIGSSNTTANNLVFGNGRAVLMRKGRATGTVAADPEFVAYSPDGSGNYRLKSNSPAVNQGTAAAAPSYDIDNTARNSAHDIGAYESY